MARGPVILGIDPGYHGGLARIDADGRLEVWPTPLAGGKKAEHDVAAMADLVRQSGADLAALEHLWTRPGQGMVSNAKLVGSFRLWQGLLAGAGIPTRLVVPQVWKRAMLGEDNGKEAAILYVEARWHDPLPTLRPRGRKKHDGCADAACIAAWLHDQVV